VRRLKRENRDCASLKSSVLFRLQLIQANTKPEFQARIAPTYLQTTRVVNLLGTFIIIVNTQTYTTDYLLRDNLNIGERMLVAINKVHGNKYV